MSDLQWVPRNLCFAMSAAMSLRPTKVYVEDSQSCLQILPIISRSKNTELEFGIRFESDSKSKRSCQKCSRQIFNSCKFLSHLKLNMDDSQPGNSLQNFEETRASLNARQCARKRFVGQRKQ